MVYVVNGVHVRGVDIILEKDFVHFAILKLEIHSFMIQIRILSMILQTFSPTLNNPSTIITRAEICGNDSHNGYDCPFSDPSFLRAGTEQQSKLR
ncbi:hypothetical protein Tco_0096880 [Tanacetum coccineum]